MSAQHTPGPWTLGDSYGPNMQEVEGPEGNALAAVWIASGTGTCGRDTRKVKPELKANARLIVAAPDLLAALEALKEWGCTYTGPRDANSPHALLIAAHHAIAKARGEYLPTDEDLARKADEECDYYHGATASNPGREDFCRGT